MDAARRSRIDELLEGALEREAAERRRWLEAQCGADTDLLRQVGALLEAHAASGGILDRGVARLTTTPERQRPPRPVGPYRILGELGRGGMSVVYRAERSDGHFRRVVALKVLRGELDAEELHGRLAAERQILAALDHPNIARLLDGGITEDGRPYLVVDYVDGLPLTTYCARRALGLEERLGLFLEVARAVQHAHGRLVVHRDLKPSNILVTSEGRVRLLDFGIAKVLDVGPVQLSGDQVPVTGAGVRLFTPGYASPEQVRGEPASVACDVWSLGVVLYELLTGSRPFGGGSPRELERRVLEEEPELPSARAEKASAIPSRRLQGDLDHIISRALQKEPERRYASAEQLAEDLERHLAGHPVRARPDGGLYRARKFLRRHRIESAAAALVLASLLGGAGTALWQAREARSERDRAELAAVRSEAVAEYLLDLFRTADPWELPADRLTARQLLVRGESRLETLPDDPLLRARVLLAMGQTYVSLGDLSGARPLLEEALAIRRSELEPADPRMVEALRALGESLRREGRLAEAEALALEALAVSRSGAHGAPAEAAALDLLGFVHTAMGRTADAMDDFGAELAVFETAGLTDHPEVGSTLVNLAAVNRRLGRYGEAERLLRAAVDHRRRTLGPDDPLTATAAARLAGLLSEHLGRYDEARTLFHEALEVHTRLLGTDHPTRGEALGGLAVIHEQTGDLEGAEAYHHEILRTHESGLGRTHPGTLGTEEQFAAFLQRTGRLLQADSIFSRTIPLRRRLQGRMHPSLAGSLGAWGRVLVELGRLDDAQSAFEEALEIRETVFGVDHALVGLALVDLATVPHARGDALERLRLLSRALEILAAFHPPGHPETVELQRLVDEATEDARLAGGVDARVR